jgi:PAS domain S-box-containing protein
MDTNPLRGKSRGPLKIAAIFLAVAVFWIFFSDRIVSSLVVEPRLLNEIQALKKWLFVIGTAWLIYFLLKREISTYQTITEHLQKSRQELLDILDAMPVGIALTDGVTIEYVNISFSERFGYSLDEIPTDAQWFLLAYPDPVYREELLTTWRAEMKRARKSGAAIRPFEVKVTCKNGQVRHAIANTQVINHRIVVILTDITERELLHNELIKMQKLESIGVLAGGIAHDFNNILTGIMGNLSYARLVLEPGHAAEQPLESAEKASERAAELTRQLLTFAQGGEPIKKVVSIGSLINEAVAFILRGTNVRGEINLDDAVLAIEADEGQVSQVLNNVLINAVQAMPEGGVLRIAAGNAQLEAANTMALPEGEYVRITIADEGFGIPEESLERIFDPYFSTKASGTGLGLASAYSIVTRHGGHIRADSTPGKGSIVTILLPATSQAPEAEPSVPANIRPPDDSQRRLPLLVMDDEAVIRNLAATMLTHLGYEVRVCADGEAAIGFYEAALAAGAPYAAVLMDLTIPGGMGGLEASRRILALDGDACLIVSSGYSHDPVMSDHQAYGFSGVLAKPYTVVELGQVLQTVLAARHPR